MLTSVSNLDDVLVASRRSRLGGDQSHLRRCCRVAGQVGRISAARGAVLDRGEVGDLEPELLVLLLLQEGGLHGLAQLRGPRARVRSETTHVIHKKLK
jgi:hypothetical protein